MIDLATKRELGNTSIAFGYGLLVWGLVDRPLMMLVAASFLIGGYAAVGQSVPSEQHQTASSPLTSNQRSPHRE